MLASSQNVQPEISDLSCQQCKEENGIIAKVIDLIETSKQCMTSKSQLDKIAVIIQGALVGGFFVLSTI